MGSMLSFRELGVKQADALDAQADTVGRMLYRFIESANQHRNRQPPPNP